MAMRIIAGAARGVELTAPAGLAVRPTAGRGREALFSMLGGSFAGCRVADLFAGSGALGLEAASRGAAAVTLVERDPSHCRAIRSNVEAVRRCGVAAEFTVVEADVLTPDRWCAAAAGAALLFADPPYDDSAADFTALFAAPEFRSAFPGAELLWELPNRPGAAGPFAAALGASDAEWELRKAGGVTFLRVKL